MPDEARHRTTIGPRCSNGLRCPGKGPVTYTYGNPSHPVEVTHVVGAPATYEGCYRYVTGRAGRVGTSSRFYCDPCAARFAARHKIDLAAVPTREAYRHEREAADRAMLGAVLPPPPTPGA
jgi:hypothetical protein